jgi:hypothetical protein
MTEISFSYKELKKWSTRKLDMQDFVDCHNLVIRLHKKYKIGFFGSRRLAHMLNHIEKWYFRND